MSDFIFRSTDAKIVGSSSAIVLGKDGMEASGTELSNIVFDYTATATAGARQVSLSKISGLAFLWDVGFLLNDLVHKLCHKLDADATLTDVDYIDNYTAITALPTAPITLAKVTTMGSDLKAAINAIVTKIDTDIGGGKTIAASACTIGSAHTGTHVAQAALFVELYSEVHRLLHALDASPDVADKDFFSTLNILSVARAPEATETKAASATQAADSTVRYTFNQVVSDGSGAGYVNTAITEGFATFAPGEVLIINETNAVDNANDQVTALIVGDLI